MPKRASREPSRLPTVNAKNQGATHCMDKTVVLLRRFPRLELPLSIATFDHWRTSNLFGRSDSSSEFF